MPLEDGKGLRDDDDDDDDDDDGGGEGVCCGCGRLGASPSSVPFRVRAALASPCVTPLCDLLFADEEVRILLVQII